MYSKHRQKNAQISPAKCGRLFVFLSFLLLSGTLERAGGNTGEQGKEPSGHACKTSSSIYQLRVETLKLSSYALMKGLKCVVIVSRFYLKREIFGVSALKLFLRVICPYMKKRAAHAKFHL